MLYDRSLYQQEVFYDELSIGQTFPPLQYRIDKPDVEIYLKSVEDEAAIFLNDDAARAEGFDGALVPPLALINYGFIYQAMRRRPPTGNLNTSSTFEFCAAVPHGASLTLNLSISDKYLKRERTYVLFKGVATDGNNNVVAIVHMELLFPKQA